MGEGEEERGHEGGRKMREEKKRRTNKKVEEEGRYGWSDGVRESGGRKLDKGEKGREERKQGKREE